MRGMRVGRAMMLAALAMGMNPGVGPLNNAPSAVQQGPQTPKDQQAPVAAGQVRQMFANLGYGPQVLQQNAHGCPWPGRRIARSRHSCWGGGRRP